MVLVIFSIVINGCGNQELNKILNQIYVHVR